MKNKLGFTFLEITITLLVIAILFMACMIVVNPQKKVNAAKVKYRYANAFETLNTVIYQLTMKEETDPFRTSAGFNKLCEGMANWINTEEVHCDAMPLSTDIAFLQNENYDFKTLTPHIVTQNGMKYYISDIIGSSSFVFYMVYVDINAEEGKKRPHTVIYDSSERTIPDVFAFALIPVGSAIPIGIAEYNINFLPAVISYKEDGNVHYAPSKYSYREAKHAAWGWYSEGGSSGEFHEHMPYTYNDYVREVLVSGGTQLYSFLSDGIFPESYATGMYEKCVPPEGSTMTPYNYCNVVIEKILDL